jgi:hypothetical protein
MNEFKLHIYLFIIPGIIGNVAHMFVVKKDLLRFLATPISSKLFGKNKTYRGFVFLPLAMGTICVIESLLTGPFSRDSLIDFMIGTGLGLSYMLAELPNSFLKRRRGIAPGESSGNKKMLQLIIDKSDSLLGACIFYYFAVGPDMNALLLLFAICFLLHVSISYLLFIIHLKKSI